MEFQLTDIEGNRFTVEQLPSSIPDGNVVHLTIRRYNRKYTITKQEWNDFLKKYNEYRKNNNIIPFRKR
jgi:hypothetical protein